MISDWSTNQHQIENLFSLSAPKAIPVIDIINEFGENCYKMAQYNDSIASCKVYSFYVDETIELDLMSKNLTLTNQVQRSNFDDTNLKKWFRDGPNAVRPISSGLPSGYNFTHLKYNMEQRLIIVRCGLKFKLGIHCRRQSAGSSSFGPLSSTSGPLSVH